MFALDFDGCRKLADHQLRTAVAEQRDGLGVDAGHRRADAHRDALADAAAQRMHAKTRLGEPHIAVAERAVGDRDVAHPRMPVCCVRRLATVGQRHVRTER